MKAETQTAPYDPEPVMEREDVAGWFTRTKEWMGRNWLAKGRARVRPLPPAGAPEMIYSSRTGYNGYSGYTDD